jgi:hypothetical protein
LFDKSKWTNVVHEHRECPTDVILLNGNETQIDCDDTAYVDVDGNNYYNLGDIYTGNCQICPTCIDEIMNGNEVGIDCGGSMCSPCATDGNCTNGVVDGNEFWTDCGGSTCPYCDSILDWNAGATAFTSLSFIKTFSGYSFDVTGTTLTSEMLNIKCAEPAAGWLPAALRPGGAQLHLGGAPAGGVDPEPQPEPMAMARAPRPWRWGAAPAGAGAGM